MIVVIDNYDSFTYNLVDYLGKLTETEIRVFRNDRVSVPDVEKLHPEAIVVSPGPKSPSDAGISVELIQRLGPTIPTLGVCLGHQAIGAAFGCEIIRAKVLMHGKVSSIVHRSHDLFINIGSPFTATRYHSLVINPARLTDVIEPIAFSVDDSEIMAVRHVSFPIVGVQFHPESIASPDGLQLLQNFLKFAST